MAYKLAVMGISCWIACSICGGVLDTRADDGRTRSDIELLDHMTYDNVDVTNGERRDGEGAMHIMTYGMAYSSKVLKGRDINVSHLEEYKDCITDT